MDGEEYRSVEHAYQAAKTVGPGRGKIRVASTPEEAKRLGREVAIRPDWEAVKVDIMLGLLREKFKNPLLRSYLLETEEAYLEEGNTWGDREWGTVNGVGNNKLGKALMQIRAELKGESNDQS